MHSSLLRKTSKLEAIKIFTLNAPLLLNALQCDFSMRCYQEVYERSMERTVIAFSLFKASGLGSQTAVCNNESYSVLLLFSNMTNPTVKRTVKTKQLGQLYKDMQTYSNCILIPKLLTVLYGKFNTLHTLCAIIMYLIKTFTFQNLLFDFANVSYWENVSLNIVYIKIVILRVELHD